MNRAPLDFAKFETTVIMQMDDDWCVRVVESQMETLRFFWSHSVAVAYAEEQRHVLGLSRERPQAMGE